MSAEALIKPANRREEVLEKLNEFKARNMTALDLKKYDGLRYKMEKIFYHLCPRKMGITMAQYDDLVKDDKKEVALMVYEKSKIPGIAQTLLLLSIPLAGWILLYASLSKKTLPSYDSPFWKNMRYFWWYRRLRNKYKIDFPNYRREEQEQGGRP